MQGKIKWLFVLFLTVQINAQSERVSEFYEYYQKLQRGDTLTFSVPQLRKIYPLLMSLLLTLPINGQVIMMGDKGYTPDSDIIPPSIPKGLNGVAVSDDSLLFYWTNPPEGDFVKNYVWFYGALKDSTVNDSIYIGGLLPNKTYGLRVKSRDDKYNYSAYSDSVQVTTLDTVTMPEVPAKPTNLVVTDSLDALTLQFTANGINTSYFDIQRDDLDYDTIDFSTKSVLVTWSEADTTDGVYHEYKVKARNATGSSAYCDSVIAERYTSNTYYVSSGGSNSNSGTNPNLAWATLGKVNAAWLEGMNVLINRNDTLNGSLSITNNNVLVGSYGTGAKPVVANYYAIPNTSSASDWEVYSSNVYRTVDPVTNFDNQVRRIFNSTDFDEIGTISNDIGSLSATQSWYYDGSKLYHYNTSAPAVWATQWYAPYYSAASENVISATGKDYITIDGLDIRGGQETLLFTNCDNLTIKNSNIKYSNRYGFVGYNCNYATIRKDTVDRMTINDWDFDIDNFGYTNSDGIYLAGSYGSIDSNYVAGWVHSGIHLEGDGRTPSYTTTNNNVFDNYVTSPINYGRGIEFVCWGSDGSYLKNNRVYRNMFHKVTAPSQFCGDSNYIYYNIFDSTLNYPNQDYESDGVRLSEVPASGGNISNIYFFNNTIHYTDVYGAAVGGSGTHFLNNMVINPKQNSYWAGGGTQGLTAIYLYSLASGMLIKNNMIFSTGKTASNLMFYRDDNSTGYTLANFNALTNVDDNLQEVTALSNILNAATWDASGDAIGGGVSITAYNIGAGFTDRNGNVVDQANPSIGAIDSP